MIDVSMAGASITINAKSGLKCGAITDFSDDGNPIDVPALEVAAAGMNMNGKMVSWTKPAIAEISFTLIPGSPSDNALRSFLHAISIGGKGDAVGEAFIASLVLKVPVFQDGSTTTKKTKTFTFVEGRLRSGMPAIGSNNDGKATSSTYTFMFEGVGK